MLKIYILATFLLAGGLAVNAQSTAASAPASGQDTSHHRFAHRGGKFQGHQGGPGGQAWANRGDEHRGPRGEFAHRGGGFRHRGFDGMARVRYTPDQRKQLMAINTDFRKKQEALYKQDNLTLGAYKAQLVALQKDRKAKSLALLTPGQQQEIARSKQHAAENQQVMAAARLERLKIRLQLSDDQEAKIKTQEADLRTQMQKIRENEDLLPDQKREQMQALFAKQKDAFTALLTPDQQAKLKEDHHRGPGGPGGWGRQRQQPQGM